MTALLELRDVSRTYLAAQPVYALRTTSLAIDSGQYITIIGVSGSGKSTLLNILGLLDQPTSGSYHVCGVATERLDEVTRGAIRGQLFGFVFQAFHLLAGRSALENVELGMLYGGQRARIRRQLATEALLRVGLDNRLHSDPRTLSGGERQRVAIARAIATRPRVVFCDEPTGNLDSANTENILSLLQDLHRDGLTVVVVTHDPKVAGHGRHRLKVSDGEVTWC
ncbi:ABC transporter ATP-binding protein [Solwaraspora sp. WMMD937]|uniref:ABC transporter ATP-binding protein n=1 Tax=Solwaraspora sp. WMMD937 TaxID=3016090 RepID=UPI00249B8EE4|nr:ABC transporter ATP-binding protein [Solwaraspora sp. WMMD937]WFE23286.1 ABC transporter ATP-binding protein [Solwaraspora sp. WMMD937]